MLNSHVPLSTSHYVPAGPACPALERRSTKIPTVSPSAGAFPADTSESGTERAGPDSEPWEVEREPWTFRELADLVDEKLGADVDELLDAARAVVEMGRHLWRERRQFERLELALKALGEPV